MFSSILSPKRLQARIVAVYLGLLVVIQAASYWFIGDSVDRNARASIRTELQTGEKVFLRLLQQNTYNLEQATKVLASDYGFRDAVGSGDRETLSSRPRNVKWPCQSTFTISSSGPYCGSGIVLGQTRVLGRYRLTGVLMPMPSCGRRLL